MKGCNRGGSASGSWDVEGVDASLTFWVTAFTLPSPYDCQQQLVLSWTSLPGLYLGWIPDCITVRVIVEAHQEKNCFSSSALVLLGNYFYSLWLLLPSQQRKMFGLIERGTSPEFRFRSWKWPTYKHHLFAPMRLNETFKLLIDRLHSLLFKPVYWLNMCLENVMKISSFYLLFLKKIAL